MMSAEGSNRMNSNITAAGELSPTMLQAILDGLPIDVLVHDRSSIIYANRGTARTLGYDHPHDLAGLPVSAIVHPESRDAGIQRRAVLFATGQHFPSVGIKLRRRDETSVTAEVMARSFRVGDETLAVVARGVFGGTAVDVGTLVSGTPEYPEDTPFVRAVLDSLPMPVIAHDTQVLVYVNDAAAKGIGLPSSAELIGRPLSAVTHPDDLEASRERQRAMVAAGLRFNRIQAKVQTGDGTPVYAICSGDVISAGSSPLVCWVIEEMSLERPSGSDQASSGR